MDNAIHDVIIIGGSYAGLSAAIQLGRARRSVLIIDEGCAAIAFSAHSHGFLTQDGVDPSVIAEKARAQVLAYPSVRLRSGRADSAHRLEAQGPDGAAFAVVAQGERLMARRLLLATGVKDNLPAIPGLAERWGKSVLHCPYCHGYELDRGPIAVIAGSALSMHHALMLPDWGPTTLLLNGAFEPDAEQLAALAARGTQIERSPVTGISGHADITLGDGRRLSFAPDFRAGPDHAGGALCRAARPGDGGWADRRDHPHDGYDEGDQPARRLCLRRCRACGGIRGACRWRRESGRHGPAPVADVRHRLRGRGQRQGGRAPTVHSEGGSPSKFSHTNP